MEEKEGRRSLRCVRVGQSRSEVRKKAGDEKKKMFPWYSKKKKGKINVWGAAMGPGIIIFARVGEERSRPTEKEKNKKEKEVCRPEKSATVVREERRQHKKPKPERGGMENT